MLLKSSPPFALWSIWRYLPFAQKLFLLILCVVGVYSLVSAIVVMACLRAMTIVPQKEDIPPFNGLWLRFTNGVPTFANLLGLLFIFLASCSFWACRVRTLS